MGAYHYRAVDTQGAVVRGVLEGDSERQIRNQLRARHWQPLEVSPASRQAQPADRWWTRLRAARLSRGELALFTRQLATLLQSGLPLADALQACARQQRKPRVAGLILQIRGRVVEGHALAQALAGLPRSFDELYVATVRAGESSGYLGQVLLRLADYTETSARTRQQTLSALIYPCVLLLVALGVVVAMMSFVMPKLVAIFAQSARALPPLTRGLIEVSAFLNHYGVYCLLALAGLVAAAQWLLRRPDYRLRWHRLLLRLPLARDWIQAVDSARFSATLAILVSSGVPLVQALRIAAEVPANLALREACAAVASRVQEGGSLYAAMERAGVFPPMLVQMVAGGEASSELGPMLARAAENQERELALTMSTLASVMEPAVVVVMGGAVLAIVLAVLLPIFDLNTLVR